MIRAHRDAVKAALEADLPGSVFSSYKATVGAKRYAVVYVAPSARVQHRYSGGQVRTIFTVTVHCVGADEDSAFWVQERVDKLTGRVLEVPGRCLQPVEFVTARPPELDDDGPTPLVYTITQFDITSDPA